VAELSSSLSSEDQSLVCRSSGVLLGTRALGREMETATPHAGEIKN